MCHLQLMTWQLPWGNAQIWTVSKWVAAHHLNRRGSSCQLVSFALLLATELRRAHRQR